MKSWPIPSVPLIPGTAAQLHLYDSADQKTKPVEVAGDTATMYVCGITPYDSTHLGHAATYVTFDVIYECSWTRGTRFTTSKMSPTWTIHSLSAQNAMASTGAN